MIIEDLKKNINNFLKEMQENTGKQVEDLKELQENETKQMKDPNKPIQYVKMEVEQGLPM